MIRQKGDLISREEASNIPLPPRAGRKYQTSNLDDAYDLGFLDALERVNGLPDAGMAQSPIWKHGTNK